MLHILICEDDLAQRTRMETIVNKYILSDDVYMDLALSVDNPPALLEYLETQQIKSGLYFLDIDLQSHLNGIELGAEIRKLDVSATIVFITSHANLLPQVFQYKIEAMEYIVKDSPADEIEKRVMECMQLAYQRYLDGKHTQTKYFNAKIGDQVLNIPYDDILFFESSITQQRKLLLHRTNSELEFRGYINDVSDLGLPFFRCHQSFVVNLNHVQRVDIATREVEMVGGAIIPIARRKMAELLRCMG